MNYLLGSWNKHRLQGLRLNPDWKGNDVFEQIYIYLCAVSGERRDGFVSATLQPLTQNAITVPDTSENEKDMARGNRDTLSK